MPTPKIPFDIHAALARVKEAVAPFAKAALFELRDEGRGSAFEQLVACIISIRTHDETTLPTARALLERAGTPSEMVRLGVAGIDALIAQSSFHAAKSVQIHAIAQRAVDEFGGALPCDYDVLVSFPGVGPKCANLVLGIACGQHRIGVDIHVHRVTNRWGYVRTVSPNETLAALERTLPDEYAVEINRLLVPFGKHVCTGARPLCSRCPVLDMCAQAGVSNPR